MPCILPENIKDIRQAIISNGGFSKLRELSADERIKLFAGYLDLPNQTKNAEWFNREIERRIFRPNQIQATREWVKRLEGKKVKISNKQALIDRITNKKDVFNSKVKTGFAGGLAKQALGFEISKEDAKTLFDLSTSANQLKDKLLAIEPNYANLTQEQLKNLSPEAQKARIEYGKKLVEFQRQYESINLKSQALEHQQKGLAGKAFDNLLRLAGNIKSVKASFDISYLRQLQSSAYVNKDAAWEAWKTGAKTWYENQEGVDTIMAELLTRPNAIAGRYNAFGVEVGIKEEAFPESWVSQAVDKAGLERFNLFRRSEAAFNLAIQSARANMFDWMWEQSNGDVRLLKEQDVGKAINTVTGRGEVSILTPKDPKSQRVINNLMFAPKWLASRIQAFTDIQYVFADRKTPQGIRGKAALGNLLMIAFSVALGAVIWGADDDDKRKVGSVLDPRSSDFGKVVIGRTRFDLTAGTASLVTLASRLTTGQSRTQKGTLRPVTWKETLGNFLSGKKAPALTAAGNIREEIAYQLGFSKKGATDFLGRELKWDTTEDIVNNIANYVAPITVQSGAEVGFEIAREGLGKEQWAAIGGVIADIIGVGANTYDKK